MTNKIDQNDLIAAAVLWWAKHLTTLPTEGINGDSESHASLLALYSKLVTARGEDMIEEKVKKFMELLTKHLEQEKKRGRTNIILGTDYGPNWPLSEICSNAGVTGVQFPGKTNMWIDFNKGTVDWETVRGSSGQVYPVSEKKL